MISNKTSFSKFLIGPAHISLLIYVCLWVPHVRVHVEGRWMTERQEERGRVGRRPIRQPRGGAVLLDGSLGLAVNAYRKR